MQNKKTTFWDLVSGVLMAAFIGFIYYEGGKSLARLFAHSPVTGRRWGFKSLKWFISEMALLFIVAPLIQHADAGTDPKWYHPAVLLFCFMLGHFAVCSIAWSICMLSDLDKP